MKKSLLFIFTSLFFFSVYGQSSNELWDKESGIYVNYTYGFAWILHSDLTWKKTIGTERHTLFRAKNEDLQIVVFVNAQRYHLNELGTDIWKQYELLRGISSEYLKKMIKSKGYDYKITSFDKVKIFGNNAIRKVVQIEPREVTEYSDPPITQYTIKTYDHGLCYSVNIVLPTAVNDAMLKDNVHVETLFNGFKFTAN